MPRISKNFTLEVTPEQFLNNCSPVELQEVALLLNSPLYQQIMNSEDTCRDHGSENFSIFLAKAKDIFSPGAERTCRVCGCTDNDCRQCIQKTGEPCSWVAEDLCSACEEL